MGDLGSRADNLYRMCSWIPSNGGLSPPIRPKFNSQTGQYFFSRVRARLIVSLVGISSVTWSNKKVLLTGSALNWYTDGSSHSSPNSRSNWSCEIDLLLVRHLHRWHDRSDRSRFYTWYQVMVRSRVAGLGAVPSRSWYPCIRQRRHHVTSAVLSSDMSIILCLFLLRAQRCWLLRSANQVYITFGIFVASCIDYGTEKRTNSGSWRVPMDVVCLVSHYAHVLILTNVRVPFGP